MDMMEKMRNFAKKNFEVNDQVDWIYDIFSSIYISDTKIFSSAKRFIKKHINDIRENDSLRIISINDFGFAPFNFGDDRQKSLILYFDDAIPIDGIYDSLIFNERMARDILNFAINASRDGKELLVHCTAGISRSSAVSINLNNFIKTG